VRSGQIPEKRIDESVLKILKAKASVGLNKARLVDVNTMSAIIARPENLSLAQQVAESAITLVRENGRVLPLKNSRTFAPAPAYGTVERQGNTLVCVIFSDDVRTDNGRQLERELRWRVPSVKIIYIDPRIAAAIAVDVQNVVTSADKVIVGVYMIPTAGRVAKREGETAINSVSLPQTPSALLQAILERARDKTMVIAFGSPYIAADFPQIENYLCAYSNVPGSETAAVKALFGEIPIQGHLPVTIPGFGQRGAGILKPATGH